MPLVESTQARTRSPRVTVGPRAVERVRRGHPWIYRSDVAEVEGRGGDVVEVLGPKARRLGEAFYSDRSEIALRLVTRGAERFDGALLRARLEQAIAFRDRLGIDATAYRLVHAEADLLPSLVVDRYGEFLVVQALSQATERLLEDVVAALEERFRPAGILARHDVRARVLEGLDQSVRVVSGEVPEVVLVREGELEYEVDLRTGQKTGLFLDQRENHAAAARYARGRLLDCFSYDGGFALQTAAKVNQVVAIDVSAEAVARIARNATRNGIANVEAQVANAFDHLREAERAGERFDTIVLDPPAFAKNRAALPRALAGYKEINLRALKMLNAGGTLVTCSCSYHVGEELFLEVVHAAARDAHATVSIVEKRLAARDHPFLLGVPETAYLKCLILRKI